MNAACRGCVSADLTAAAEPADRSRCKSRRPTTCLSESWPARLSGSHQSRLSRYHSTVSARPSSNGTLRGW